jgi:SAM-dependent methyltransferase
MSPIEWSWTTERAPVCEPPLSGRSPCRSGRRALSELRTKTPGLRQRYVFVESPDTAPTRSHRDALGAWRRRKLGAVKRRARQLIVAEERRHARVRRRLAAQYLAGHGLEIGALFLPLHVPSGASVRYVDRFRVPELRKHYPELNDFDLVTPDVVDDGETLAGIPDASTDFVIANHFIEHCEDPIGTLQNHLRVLRPGGILYMAVPDCRYTFDRDRSITTLAHVERDYVEGAACSRRGHYEEWVRCVHEVSVEEVSSSADELERRMYSIHFHVWTPSAFLDLLTHCRVQLGAPLEVEAMERNDHEFIVVMSRAHTS